MKRLAELDAIRGLAALAILVNHLPFSNRLTHLGAYGVDLFFVLSGYLITAIILRDGDSKGFLAAFYVRRSLRIWPIYYLMLVVVILVNPAFHPRFRLDGWPWYAAYIQGIPRYWGETPPPFTPLYDHTWTLALEEQYYLLWPALILLLGRRSVVPLALGFAAVATIARARGVSDRLLLGRCDGFALGGLLAGLLVDLDRVRARPREAIRGFSLALAGVAGLWLLVSLTGVGKVPGSAASGQWYGSLRVLAVTLCFTALIGLILVGAGSRPLAPLRDRRLSALGQISYGLYLYHYPIYFLADALIGPTPVWGISLLKIGTSLVVAWLSWTFIETPILGLKGRFQYRSGDGAGARSRVAR